MSYRPFSFGFRNSGSAPSGGGCLTAIIYSILAIIGIFFVISMISAQL